MAIEWKAVRDGYSWIGVDWNVSVSNDSVTYAPIVYLWYEVRSSDSYIEHSWNMKLDGTSVTSGSNTYSTGGAFSGSRVFDSYGSRTVARGTSEKTITLDLSFSDLYGGYGSGWTGSWSGKWTYTVPTLPSYTVKYDANGGSGAPSNQTKWYGGILTLSSTKPTKSGYNFMGWATSSAGSVAYASGAQYGSDANVTLYAVWELAYIAPTLSNVKAVRCNSSGTADNGGTYAKVTGSWAVDTTLNAANKATKLVIEYRLPTSTTWTASNTTLNAASGTISKIVGGGNIATGSSYYIRVTVYDSGGNKSVQVTLTPTFISFDIGNSGHTVAVGKAASNTEGFEVAIPARFEDGIYIDGNLVNDYIIAQGTSGVWHYRKWASGKAECWYVVSHNTGSFSWWNSKSYIKCGANAVPSYSYPFTWAATPTIIANVVNDDSGASMFGVTEGIAPYRTTHSSKVWAVPGSSEVVDPQTAAVMMYVIGRWK